MGGKGDSLAPRIPTRAHVERERARERETARERKSARERERDSLTHARLLPRAHGSRSWIDIHALKMTG